MTATLIAPELAAVRHLLTTPSIAARTEPYVAGDAIDWTSVLAQVPTMSAGEALLVRVAHDLWEASGSASTWELQRRLGPGHFERVIEALRISRGDLAFAA
jgi:hypothetical protein